MSRQDFFTKEGTPRVVWSPDKDILKKPDVNVASFTRRKEHVVVVPSNVVLQKQADTSTLDSTQVFTGNTLLERYDDLMRRFKNTILSPEHRQATMEEIQDELGRLNNHLLSFNFIQQANNIPLKCIQTFDSYLKQTRNDIVCNSPLNVAYPIYLGVNDELNLDQYGPRVIHCVEPIDSAREFIQYNAGGDYEFYNHVSLIEFDTVDFCYINDEYMPKDLYIQLLFAIYKMKNSAGSNQKYIGLVAHKSLGSPNNTLDLIKRMPKDDFEGVLNLMRDDDDLKNALLDEYERFAPSLRGGAVDIEEKIFDLDQQNPDIADLQRLFNRQILKTNIVEQIAKQDIKIRYGDKLYVPDRDGDGNLINGDRLEIGDLFVQISNTQREPKVPPFLKGDVFKMLGRTPAGYIRSVPLIGEDAPEARHPMPSIYKVILASDRPPPAHAKPISDDEEEDEEDVKKETEKADIEKAIRESLVDLKEPRLLTRVFDVTEIKNVGKCDEKGYSGFMYVITI